MEEQGNEHALPSGDILGDILLNDPSVSSNSTSRILRLKRRGERTSERDKSEVNEIFDSPVELSYVGMQSDDCCTNFVSENGNASYCAVECDVVLENAEVSTASSLSNNKKKYGRDEHSCAEVITIPSNKKKKSGRRAPVRKRKDEVLAENVEPVSQVQKCIEYPTRSKNNSHLKSREDNIVCGNCQQNKQKKLASDVLAVQAGAVNGNSQCRSTVKTEQNIAITPQVSCNLQDYSLHKDTSGSKIDLERHQIHKAEEIFSCPYCGCECSRKWNLKRHLLTHSADETFQCSHCEYKCSERSDLKSHMLLHTNGKPFQCSQCEYRCSRKQHLNRHMLTHTADKPYGCSKCEYRCYEKDKLKLHMLSHNDDKPFQCCHCEYRCSRKVYLKRHMLIHTADKPFQCSQCEFSCSEKGNLEKHMMAHTADKPFHCSQCDYSCSQKISLEYHMFTHTGDKPIQCPQCEYTCCHKGNLKIHMLKHTSDKPFQCSHCEYSCLVKNNLTRHMLIHTAEKPFHCPHCDYKCSQKGNLKRHMLTHNVHKPS